MKYYIADLHFDHDNIINLANRPFKNVNEMNETMITNWNITVKKGDDVYIVGDFAWSREEHFFNRLVGRKHLIIGNHDGDPTQRIPKWASVNQYLELKDSGFNLVLFHYPIFEWNRLHRGAIHFYGHVHGKPITLSSDHHGVLENGTDPYGKNKLGQAFDVCVEKLNYVPRTLDDILINYKYFTDSPVTVTA